MATSATAHNISTQAESANSTSSSTLIPQL